MSAAETRLLEVMAAADLAHQEDGFARQLVHDDVCCMEPILDALLAARSDLLEVLGLEEFGPVYLPGFGELPSGVYRFRVSG